MHARLEEIVRAIGLGSAMKLVENFGGTRVYLPLPENIEPHNEVARVIGIEAARKLSAVPGWAQQRPSIPMARRHLVAIMKNEIRRDQDKLTVPELARKYETTERNIYRYLSEPDAGDERAEQRKLF